MAWPHTLVFFMADAPFTMEAIRRIGRLFERDEKGEKLVLAALAKVYKLVPQPFVRLGLEAAVAADVTPAVSDED